MHYLRRDESRLYSKIAICSNPHEKLVGSVIQFAAVRKKKWKKVMQQDQALHLLKMGKNIFLTGAAGSGKTYLLNHYIKYLKENNVPVAVTASTGIAATHLQGMTLHSWSGIGVKDHLSQNDLEHLLTKERVRRNYKKTKVLII